MLSFEQKENYQTSRVDFIRLWNSAFLFVAALTIVNLFRELVFFGICYHNPGICKGFGAELSYSVNIAPWVYLIKFEVVLVLGVLSVLWFKRRRERKPGFNNLFLLWVSIISFVFVLAELLMFNFNSYKGVAGFFRYYSLDLNWLIGIDIVLILGFVFLCKYIAFNGVGMSNSRSKLLKPSSRRNFLYNIYIIPAFIGSLIMVLVDKSYIKSEKAYFLFLIFLILIIALFFLGDGLYRKVKIVRYPTSDKVYYFPVVLVLIFLVLKLFFV